MANTVQLARSDNDFGTVTPVGTTLATAPVLVNGINVCPASAGATAVALPQNAAGPVIVRNSAAAATALLVFPPTSAGTINGGAAGASFSVNQNLRAVFFPHPNGVDYTAILTGV